MCARITAATFSAPQTPFHHIQSHLPTRPTHALISSKSEGGGCSEELHIASPNIISGGTCSQPLPELTHNSFGPKTNKQRSRTNSGNALEPAQPVTRNSSHTPELYAWNFIVGLHQKDTKHHAHKWDRCNIWTMRPKPFKFFRRLFWILQLEK